MNEQNSPDVSRDNAGSPAASFQAYGNAAAVNDTGTEDAIIDRTPGQAFMRALQAMEKHRNIDHLVEQFSSECRLWRQSYAQPYEATTGARNFWDQYLKQFASIQKNFTHVIERDDLSILEWESHGQLQGGRAIHYRGVSIVEFGADAKVQTFRTYFDSAHFISSHASEIKH